MTGAFYFSCRQTYSGRMLRTVCNCHSRELFDHARKGGRPVVRGLDLDTYSSRHTSIPDKVAFRVDTQSWLHSLTENQRRRVLDLADGHSTKECAHRWNVTVSAVSICRRQLHGSFAWFMGPKPEE